MPKLSTHKTSKAFKAMVIGDSGSGKTGALASLVKAGFKPVIMDFDNGLDILSEVVAPEDQENIFYATFKDDFKSIGGKVIPKGQAKAWANSLKFLESGKTPDGDDFMSVDKLTRSHVLVIDSLTMAAKSAMLQVLQANNRLLDNPQIQDWGEAQRIVEGLIQWLTSDQVPCHVLVNSHISYVELQGGMVKGYPSAVGKALSAILPRYFNTLLLAQSKGNGKAAKRTITALPQGIIETKALIPADKLPESWPITTGLADIFKAAGFKPE